MSKKLQFEAEFEVVCTCGNSLTVNKTSERYGVSKIETDPCSNCITKEVETAVEKAVQSVKDELESQIEKLQDELNELKMEHAVPKING